MDQWVDSLQSFLGLAKKEIGQIGGGKHKITGVVDVAMIQSLVDKGTVNDLVGNYGQIIVDECHHISAASFEQVIRRPKLDILPGCLQRSPARMVTTQSYSCNVARFVTGLMIVNRQPREHLITK